jgi:hypothetical protein
MKGIIALLAFVTLTGFGGCGTVSTTTPVFDIAKAQRDVFAAKEGYAVAERLAIAYAQLARCAVPAVQPCSSVTVLAQITSARNIARTSLAAAQTAVDTPGFGNDVISTAVVAAQSGLKAFETISNQTGSK